MDETIQKLQRDYAATGDETIGLSLINALLRNKYFDARIRQHISAHLGYSADYETFYTAWSPVDDNVLIINIVRNYSEPTPPPRVQLREHLSSHELWAYERSWDEYNSQYRGEIIAFLHLFAPKDSTGVYEYRHFSAVSTLQPVLYWFGRQLDLLATAQLRHGLPGSQWISIIDRLSADYDFAEELEPLEEEPEIDNEFGDHCEDYPACGHDICPRHFTTGEQAEMVCVCGRSLPPDSRYSICADCLREDDWDDYGPEYGDYDEDYEENEDDDLDR